jgi:hypothetical protein
MWVANSAFSQDAQGTMQGAGCCPLKAIHVVMTQTATKKAVAGPGRINLHELDMSRPENVRQLCKVTDALDSNVF